MLGFQILDGNKKRSLQTKTAVDGWEQLTGMNKNLQGKQNKWQKSQIKPETSTVFS